MARVMFSSDAALGARLVERKRIRKFDDKDDVRIGDDYYMSFLYDGPARSLI